MTPSLSHDTFAARPDMLVRAVDDDHPVTAAAVRDTSRRLAAGMARFGVKADGRVVVWLPNGTEWVWNAMARPCLSPSFCYMTASPPIPPAGWPDTCRRELPGYKVPAGFHVLDAFPAWKAPIR
jgi:hypothetical protein